MGPGNKVGPGKHAAVGTGRGRGCGVGRGGEVDGANVILCMFFKDEEKWFGGKTKKPRLYLCFAVFVIPISTDTITWSLGRCTHFGSRLSLFTRLDAKFPKGFCFSEITAQTQRLFFFSKKSQLGVWRSILSRYEIILLI